MKQLIEGACLCGAVHWTFPGEPDGATACNCTACRRYGVLWAYDYESDGQTVGINIRGTTRAYVRGKALEFHFCPECGCVAFWRGLRLDEQGRRRIAVNLRLAEPEAVVQIPIDHFDGLDTFDDLPRDGKCVADYWF
ncbi:GFA family protein [Undibacterium flavidum]|uniref:GFA family protein n=1 Tax=Undibacterium flavidum TaxID=2762297 RepID=A0ABR6Y626_9BURK|nr:GFA family protein [Undibacterium flavidum]MBC3872072.1 GFA family protein [Undibacterium flavidum]